jgi:hypothetical protein
VVATEQKSRLFDPNSLPTKWLQINNAAKIAQSQLNEAIVKL